ncbi:hypothetical protein V5735_19370 [Haladaptatus sp. SPP-AMP-3]|uniref:helix-turn-helix transcriptional regulator n=1 Tax=Haladaptatus sp. SPP-AMP-3 TaxID=3121295 RepID=UPI003C2ED265
MDGKRDDIETLMSVVSRLEHLFDQLVAGVSKRSQMKEQLPESRSTIYRGLDTLIEHGFAYEQDGNYVPTTYGYLVFQTYKQLCSTIESVADARPLLESNRCGNELNSSILVDADIHISEGHAPNAPLQQLTSLLADTDTIHQYLSVVSPYIIDHFHRQLVNRTLHVEIVSDTLAIDYLTEQFTEKLSDIEIAGTFELYQAMSDLPFGLIIADGSQPWMSVMMYGQAGNLLGVIINDTPESLEWAEKTYESVVNEKKSIPIRS